MTTATSAGSGARLAYKVRAKQGDGKFPQRFTRQLADGVSALYGRKPGGNAALIEVRFDRYSWTSERAKAWMTEHDETAIAGLAKLDAPVYLRIVEDVHPFAGDGSAKPKIDRDAGVMRDVKFVGWESSNGRTYRPALKAAVALYEGAAINSNHPEPGQAVPWEKRLGVAKNVRLAEDGIRGDFHFNPKHKDMDALLWFAENQPGAVAMSHRINAVGRTRADGIFEVQRIDKVFAVEVVADGGTNRSLFESARDDEQGAGDDMDVANLTLADIREANPGLFQAMREQIESEGAIKQTKADLESARKDLAEAKAKLAEHDRAAADARDLAESKELCQKAEMPENAITEAFLGTLSRKKAEDKRALIEDRMALVRESGPKPTSKAKDHKQQAGERGNARPDSKALVESAKSVEDFERLVLS